ARDYIVRSHTRRFIDNQNAIHCNHFLPRRRKDAKQKKVAVVPFAFSFAPLRLCAFAGENVLCLQALPNCDGKLSSALSNSWPPSPAPSPSCERICCAVVARMRK